jgi:ABC-2 type transport system permease protein
MTTANNILRPVTSRGWLRGFDNLLDHEHHLWWGGRKWLLQLLIWILLINGSVAFLGIAAITSKDALREAGSPELTPERIYMMEIQVFFQFASLCTAVGAVISSQGAIIQEKQMGTAAWILSKPVSRNAFVLAKLIAHSSAFLALAVVVPTILFCGEIYLLAGIVPAPLDLLAGMGIWALLVLFYLTLTIMLGALFNSHGAVLGIALGFMFAGFVIPNALPDAAMIFPWVLGQLALALALGPSAPGPLPPTAIIPVIATILWIVIFIALALWGFGKEEF